MEPHESLQRQIHCTPRHRVVTDIDNATRLQMTVDKAKLLLTRALADPGIDTVRDDVVETSEIKGCCRCEIRSQRVLC
jgi:hypothetical protein